MMNVGKNVPYDNFKGYKKPKLHLLSRINIFGKSIGEINLTSQTLKCKTINF